MSTLDSVLVTARVPSLEQVPGEERENPQSYGGNGFVWRGFVVTSATWLASLLQLEPFGPHSRPTGVKWKLSNTETVFHVIYDSTTSQPLPTTPDNKSPNQATRKYAPKTHLETCPRSGLTVTEAQISSVHILQDVYSCLATEIHSLGQWRCELQSVATDGGGGKERVREEGGGGEFVSVDSLLLPLSCVVLLKVKGLSLSPATAPLPRCTPYRPCVGETLVAISTPFAAYCPEIFHSTMTTGCVCKLIGRNSGVFLTDACHLPGSEGAGLRRNICTGVVAMVMTPLFSEKGHPTGLSLATTLSSLPPPHSHHYLPPPHSHNSLPPPHSHFCDVTSGVCRLVVAVATSSTWGSGFLLSSDRVLTCAHVVKSKLGSVSVYQSWSHSPPYLGSVLEWNQDMDIAIIGLRQSIVESHVLELLQDQFNQPNSWHHPTARGYHRGPVYAIGYEAPPWTSCGPLRPLVTQGVVGKVVSDHWDGEGVMLVTSAVVLPGMSGGVMVSGEDGRMLGMIVSISEDMTSGYTYPTVNYSLSLPWLLPALRPYVLAGDGHCLHQFLMTNGERVKQLWSLSKLPPSKL